MVFYDGIQLTQVDDISKVGPGTFFSQGSYPNASGTQKYNFNITGIVIGDDPADHEVHVTNKQGLFVLRDDGCSLKGVGIRRYAPSMAYQGASKLIGSNCTVENVYIEDMATVAVGGFTGDNQVWRNVTCTRAGTMGMTSSQSNNVLFDNCLITANNCHFSNYAPVAAGIKVTRLRKITIRNSVIRDNYASGIWFDECVTDATVDNCRVTSNEAKGIISELAGDTLVHNTLVTGNGSYGIGSMDADGIHLYSTTLAHNGNGINRFTGASFGAKRQISVNADDRAPWHTGVPTDPRYPAPGQGHPDPITYRPQRTVIKNSLIDRPPSGQALFAWEDFNRADGSEWPWSMIGLDFAGNIWSRSGEE